MRGKPDPEDNLAEEMADVTICIGFVAGHVWGYGRTFERLD